MTGRLTAAATAIVAVRVCAACVAARLLLVRLVEVHRHEAWVGECLLAKLAPRPKVNGPNRQPRYLVGH